jgi:hypothetical protein
MHAPMKHARANPVEPRRDAVRSTAFECIPWLAQERVLDEPRARLSEPVRLELDEHVIDAALDGDAIVRAD